MVKITKTGSQYRITLPSEIIKSTGWKEGTELIFDPYTETAKERITKKTPILLKKVGK